MGEQKIPKSIQKRLNGWFFTFWAFLLCHYLFGIGGVIASTFVVRSDDTREQKIAGIISAICIAIIGFMQPNRKYSHYVTAWRILDEKVNMYRYNLITIRELVEGMAFAEKTLGQVEIEVLQSPQQGTNNKQVVDEKVQSETT